MSAPVVTQRRASLGISMATALVIGNMIGSGVFLLPASLAAYGPISIIALALTGVGAMLLALVFAKLGRAYPETGGPYAYSRRAFGDFIGFQQAWGYWIAAWAGNAAIAIAFVSYLGEYWPSLRDNNFLAAMVALAAIWVLTGVNSLGVRQGGFVQVVTTVVKFIPLAGIGIIGLFFIKSANFDTLNVSGDSNFGAITAAGALTLWAFIGLESATVPAEDVKDPERTIPRSTIIGTLVTAVVYILGMVAVMGVIPPETLAASGAPFSDAAQEMFGGWATDLITICAIAATFGALNGWILIQGQVPMAAARDRLFPKPFARTSANGTPVFGLVVSSVLVTLLMFMNYTKSLTDQFTFIILLATLTTLVPYAFSAMAELMLFVTDRAAFSGRRLLKDGIIATLAFGYSLWAIAGSGYEVVFKGFMLLMAGIPVFVWVKWRASKEGAPAAERQPLVTDTPPAEAAVVPPPVVEPV
jgi:APA family basic amino acid/polyamine antiporter